MEVDRKVLEDALSALHESRRNSHFANDIATRIERALDTTKSLALFVTFETPCHERAIQYQEIFLGDTSFYLRVVRSDLEPSELALAVTSTKNDGEIPLGAIPYRPQR